MSDGPEDREGEIRYAWMERRELHRIAEIDRSERITLSYVVDAGRLKEVPVDWDSPGWSTEGDGDFTVAHQIHFCEGHMDRDGVAMGAFDGERLVGIAVLRPRLTPDTAQLAFLHISRAYRRHGIGTHLTREMCRVGRESGHTKIYVSAVPSESAVGFYRREGFELVREPNPDLFALEPEDIHMVKAL